MYFRMTKEEFGILHSLIKRDIKKNILKHSWKHYIHILYSLTLTMIRFFVCKHKKCGDRQKIITC